MIFILVIRTVAGAFTVKLVFIWMPQILTYGELTKIHVITWRYRATGHYLMLCWHRPNQTYSSLSHRYWYLPKFLHCLVIRATNGKWICKLEYINPKIIIVHTSMCSATGWCNIYAQDLLLFQLRHCEYNPNIKVTYLHILYYIVITQIYRLRINMRLHKDNNTITHIPYI